MSPILKATSEARAWAALRQLVEANKNRKGWTNAWARTLQTPAGREAFKAWAAAADTDQPLPPEMGTTKGSTMTITKSQQVTDEVDRLATRMGVERAIVWERMPDLVAKYRDAVAAENKVRKTSGLTLADLITNGIERRAAIIQATEPGMLSKPIGEIRNQIRSSEIGKQLTGLSRAHGDLPVMSVTKSHLDERQTFALEVVKEWAGVS